MKHQNHTGDAAIHYHKVTGNDVLNFHKIPVADRIALWVCVAAVLILVVVRYI